MERALILRALPVLALCALLYSASSVMAQGSPMRVVLKGHDPVAYFTEGKAVKGNPKFSYDWDDGRYQFASARNRDASASSAISSNR